MSTRLNRRSLLMLAASIATVRWVPALAEFSPEALRERIINGDKRPVVYPGEVRFGCYDPQGDFASQTDVSTEHLFLPWVDVDLTSLSAADQYAYQRGRKLMITIEPWSWGTAQRGSRVALQNGITAGDYDANIAAIIDAIKDVRSPLIIRWGQEMDDAENRFIWAGWRPEDFIPAYNHVMQQFRDALPDAQLMWSPKGLPNMNDYYPDDTLVDIVGLSLFGLDRYDLAQFEEPKYFVERMMEPYGLAEIHGKPVWIAELGYEGEDSTIRVDYMEQWAMEVTKRHQQFPALEEVVWFNDREPNPWPGELGRPDWRVIRETRLTQK